MKFVKSSTIMCVIAIILCATIGGIAISNSTTQVFESKTSYMDVPNLALNVGNGGLKKLTDGKVSTCYTSYNTTSDIINIDLKSVQTFNSIVLKEAGLNIKSFEILVSLDGQNYQSIYRGDKIEYHRLCTFDSVTAQYVRLIIGESDGKISLKELEIYNQPTVSLGNFRNVAYLVNSNLYTWINDESLTESQKLLAMQKALLDYNIQLLTHINFYCGLGFDDNGNILLGSNSEKEFADLDLAMQAIRASGRSDLKITCVIGIGTNHPSRNKAMDDNRQSFIDNFIAFANRFDFDGIDFDYEFPQSKYDFKVFEDFLKALKEQMKTKMHNGEQSILSCAFGTRDLNFSKSLVDTIDIVNMMTYDIFDQDGQHSSFWSSGIQGAKYLEEFGFKKSQINIGIPFYGTQVDALMEQYIYNNIISPDYFTNTYTFNSYYDGSPTQVYFNSPAMVRDKTAYALLADYGGIMVWHMHCDLTLDNEFSLWRATNKALEQFGGAAI